MNDDEKWQTTYDNLIKFMNEHKKRPSSTSDNLEKKQLGMYLWIPAAKKLYNYNLTVFYKYLKIIYCIYFTVTRYFHWGILRSSSYTGF